MVNGSRPWIAVCLCLLVAVGLGRGAEADAAVSRGVAGTAGACGSGDSTVHAFYLQYTGSLDAVSLETVAQSDGQRTTHRLGFDMSQPWDGASLAMHALRFVADGSYAGTVRSGTHVGALARTNWPGCGGSAVDNQSPAATDVIVPFAAGMRHGETSIVAVQSTDVDRVVQARLELVPEGGTAPALTGFVDIPAGRSVTVDLAAHPALADLSPGFSGWMRVSAAAPVAVQSWIDVDNPRRGVFAFEGVPAAEASDRVMAPIVHAEAAMDAHDPTSPRLSSRLAVVNPGVGPSSFVVTYHGTAGTCAGSTSDTAPMVLAGGQGVVLDLSRAGDPSGPVLPSGCVASALLSTSDGGRVVAAVLTADETGDLAAAYTAFTHEGQGNSWTLPLVHRDHGPERMTSAVQVANMGDLPTSVWIAFVDECGQGIPGCGEACRVTLPGRGSAHLWWLGGLDAVPAGTAGRAVVGANTNGIVVAVVDVPRAGGVDAAAYRGLAVGADAVPLLPLLLRDSAVPTPTAPVCPPTATPRDTPGATPSPTPGSTASASPVPASPSPSATSGAPSPTPLGALPGQTVCRYIARKAPPAAVADALANPERFSGWGQRCHPNLPAGPWNGERRMLTLLRPSAPYHLLYNPLVYRCQCP